MSHFWFWFGCLFPKKRRKNGVYYCIFFYLLCLYRILVQKSSFGGVVCYLILLWVRNEQSMEESGEREEY